MTNQQHDEQKSEINSIHELLLAFNCFGVALVFGGSIYFSVPQFVIGNLGRGMAGIIWACFVLIFLYFASNRKIGARLLGGVYSLIVWLITLSYFLGLFGPIFLGADQNIPPNNVGIVFIAFCFATYFFGYFLFTDRVYRDFRALEGEFASTFVTPWIIVFTILYGGIIVGISLR